MKNVVVTCLKKDSHCKQIKRLYKSTFPFFERLPFFLINKHVNNKYFILTKYLDETNNDLIGFTILVNESTFVYGFYFVIDKKKRNMGIGTQILQNEIDSYKNVPGIFCVDYCPDINDLNDIKARRINFYLRNGLSILPYTLSVYNCKYYVLTNKPDIDALPFFKIMKKVYGRVWIKLFTIVFHKKGYKFEPLNS